MRQSLINARLGGFVPSFLINRVADIGGEQFVSAKRHLLTDEKVLYRNPVIVDEVVLTRQGTIPAAVVTAASLAAFDGIRNGYGALGQNWIEFSSDYSILVHCDGESWFEKFKSGDKVVFSHRGDRPMDVYWAVIRAQTTHSNEE